MILRRRTYDALNVLTAMDIIAKDKKDIQWKGFTRMVGDSGDHEGGGGTSGGEDKEKALLKARIEQKNKELRQKEGNLKELVSEFVGLKQLLARNAEVDSKANSEKHQRIYLPFVIGECSVSSCTCVQPMYICANNLVKPFFHGAALSSIPAAAETQMI